MNNMNALGPGGAGGLSEAALAAIAGFARLGDADRATALRMLGIRRGTRVWTPRALDAVPTLTGLVEERDREAIYGSAAWASLYRPGRTVVAYVLQARGLADLSAALEGLSLVKAGTAAKENVTRRIADLGADEYGAWHRGGRRYEHASGFAAFLPAPRLQLAPQHPLSPVRLCGVGIEIVLPAGTSDEAFEADFNRRVNPLRLHVFAGSEAGHALCARTGLHATALHRFYKIRGPFKAATEITLMRPQADVGALARLCADIVIDVVLGLAAKRPSR